MKQDNTQAAAVIRRALHIGLASFGELERLEDAIGARCPEEIDHKELHVIHPTGVSGTVSLFADALQFLDILEQANS